MVKHVAFAISISFAVVVLSHSSFVAVVTNASLLAAGPSQQTQAPQPASPAGRSMQPNMAEMMKMHEQMMAEMKAADAKLDELVKDMNAAMGEAKTSAIAQVVNELVRQQKAMHEHMQQMMPMMMGGRGMMKK